MADSPSHHHASLLLACMPPSQAAGSRHACSSRHAFSVSSLSFSPPSWTEGVWADFDFSGTCNLPTSSNCRRLFGGTTALGVGGQFFISPSLPFSSLPLSPFPLPHHLYTIYILSLMPTCYLPTETSIHCVCARASAAAVMYPSSMC